MELVKIGAVQDATMLSPKHDNAPHSLNTLLGRCALRDRAAFSALYQVTSANLFGIALRIVKKRVWAEEVLQEAFVKIWSHASSYDANRGTPMTWMINVVRNQAFDMKRRADVRAELNSVPVDDDLLQGSDDANPAEQLAIDSQLARLQRCLGQLVEEQRRCMLLVYHEGYTLAEIATRLNFPLGTVKTWVRRGLMRVRECMQR
jgi:RNA polymerase sigma-70 factor, ECF subfamily